MCEKLSGEESAQLNICEYNCIFARSKKFKDLVEFAEMSLINGFQEYLFEELCECDMVNSWSGPIMELKSLIDWYTIAMKYEKKSGKNKGVHLENQKFKKISKEESEFIEGFLRRKRFS